MTTLKGERTTSNDSDLPFYGVVLNLGNFLHCLGTQHTASKPVNLQQGYNLQPHKRPKGPLHMPLFVCEIVKASQLFDYSWS